MYSEVQYQFHLNLHTTAQCSRNCKAKNSIFPFSCEIVQPLPLVYCKKKDQLRRPADLLKNHVLQLPTILQPDTRDDRNSVGDYIRHLDTIGQPEE